MKGSWRQEGSWINVACHKTCASLDTCTPGVRRWKGRLGFHAFISHLEKLSDCLILRDLISGIWEFLKSPSLMKLTGWWRRHQNEILPSKNDQTPSDSLHEYCIVQQVIACYGERGACGLDQGLCVRFAPASEVLQTYFPSWRTPQQMFASHCFLLTRSQRQSSD